MAQQNEATMPTAIKRPISGDHKHERGDKRKSTIERFTSPGNYEDEITMLFDDGKQLFVSKTFLRHVSQVFQTMFDKSSKYVENKDGIIKMVDKSYDNVLELLHHLDPSIQKEIDQKNVLEIVRLAEEYMIDVSIKKCRNCLTSFFPYTSYASDRIQAKIVDALLTAIKYGYKDVQENAVKEISRWPHFHGNWPQLYDSLPEESKLKILEKRLKAKGDSIVPR